MKFYHVAFLAAMLIPKLSWAGAYVMPVSVVGSHVTQEIVSWLESPDALNPCYGKKQCYIGPDVQYDKHPPGLYGSCHYYDNCIEISQYKTASEVVDAYNKKHAIPFTTSFDINNENATCVGLFYVDHAPVSGEENALIWPGSTCGKLPPANQYCHLTAPNVIDFGTVSAGHVDGIQKHIVGSIKCTKSANIELYAYSAKTNTKGVVFDENSSLTGDLYINQEDAFSGVSILVPEGNIEKDFDFSVSLKSTGNIDAGDFSASALIVASFQ